MDCQVEHGVFQPSELPQAVAKECHAAANKQGADEATGSDRALSRAPLLGSLDNALSSCHGLSLSGEHADGVARR